MCGWQEMDEPPAAQREVVLAARGGRLADVQRLVGEDPRLLEAELRTIDADTGFEFVLTPLSAAAARGHLDVVAYLLDQGADINHTVPDGPTALTAACTMGHTVVVDLLLERGADAGVADGRGPTPLKSAAVRGHVGIVRTLLAHGCGDVDDRPRGSATALWRSCRDGQRGALRAMLEAGADPTIRCGVKGRTPLKVAVDKQHDACVALLQVRRSAAYVGSEAEPC
jgi:ankyrin repeat protein